MQGMRVPRESPAGWVISAPAKLNVLLDVLPRRPDGFHGIRTLLCPIKLSDTLVVRPTNANDGSVNLTVRSLDAAIDPAGVPTGDSNLICRALRAAWRRRDLAASCEVEVHKRTPSQAGLGGGSGDAAAAIVAANQLWALGLTEQEMLAAAAEVGSDVPGQLSGGANLCEGRGELVTPTPVPAGVPLVIAKPGAGLSTADVFRRCRPGASSPTHAPAALASALWSGDWRKTAQLMTNHLQAAAMELCEDLRKVAGLFDRLPLVAHQMTGSGAAYFGVCRSHQQAKQSAAWLRSQGVAWAVATGTA